VKTLIKLSVIILAGIYHAPAYSQIDIPDDTEIYSRCAEETNHERLYNYGKDLAEGWLYYVANPSKFEGGEKRYPTKTKIAFFRHGYMGFNDKYKITQTGEYSSLFTCYRAYYATAGKKPWSSVHSGLVDYLPAKHKAKFLSLPER